MEILAYIIKTSVQNKLHDKLAVYPHFGVSCFLRDTGKHSLLQKQTQ